MNGHFLWCVCAFVGERFMDLNEPLIYVKMITDFEGNPINFMILHVLILMMWAPRGLTIISAS